jgi:hypothetical protein
MQDRPSVSELLELSAQFIEREIVPITEGARQFQARVVANVMRIVTRELQLEEPQLREEISALADLLKRPVPAAGSLEQSRAAAAALNAELSARIRAGDADQGSWRRDVLGVVRKLVEEKLRVANPRYLEADRATRARAG